MKALSQRLFRQDLDKRVLLLAGVLFLALVMIHGVLFFLYNASRGAFEGATASEHTISKFQLRGDPREALFSSTVTSNPCDYDLTIDCKNESDPSPAVQILSKQQEPLPIRHILERHTYGSAYDVVKALLVQGHDHDASILLGDDVFDSDPDAVVYRSSFANKWYLLPAMSYASHNREYDGVSLFKQYLDIMRFSVKNNHWLSWPGLDATDLPVLADIFCTDTDRLKQDECLLGLLQLASSQAANFSTEFYLEGDGKNLPDLGKIYGKAPVYLRKAALLDYLSIWSWDGSGAEPEEENLTTDQTAAWKYALAVRLLDADKQHDDCPHRVARSRDLLASVSAAGDSFGYFKRAADNRLTYIAKHEDDLCKARDDDDAKR